MREASSYPDKVLGARLVIASKAAERAEIAKLAYENAEKERISAEKNVIRRLKSTNDTPAACTVEHLADLLIADCRYSRVNGVAPVSA